MPQRRPTFTIPSSSTLPRCPESRRQCAWFGRKRAREALPTTMVLKSWQYSHPRRQRKRLIKALVRLLLGLLHAPLLWLVRLARHPLLRPFPRPFPWPLLRPLLRRLVRLLLLRPHRHRHWHRHRRSRRQHRRRHQLRHQLRHQARIIQGSNRSPSVAPAAAPVAAAAAAPEATSEAAQAASPAMAPAMAPAGASRSRRSPMRQVPFPAQLHVPPPLLSPLHV